MGLFRDKRIAVLENSRPPQESPTPLAWPVPTPDDTNDQPAARTSSVPSTVSDFALPGNRRTTNAQPRGFGGLLGSIVGPRPADRVFFG